MVGFSEQIVAWSHVCISFGVAGFSCSTSAVAQVSPDWSHLLAIEMVKSLLAKKDGL